MPITPNFGYYNGPGQDPLKLTPDTKASRQKPDHDVLDYDDQKIRGSLFRKVRMTVSYTLDGSGETDHTVPQFTVATTGRIRTIDEGQKFRKRWKFVPMKVGEGQIVWVNRNSLSKRCGISLEKIQEAEQGTTINTVADQISELVENTLQRHADIEQYFLDFIKEGFSSDNANELAMWLDERWQSFKEKGQGEDRELYGVHFKSTSEGIEVKLPNQQSNTIPWELFETWEKPDWMTPPPPTPVELEPEPVRPQIHTPTADTELGQALPALDEFRALLSEPTLASLSTDSAQSPIVTTAHQLLHQIKTMVDQTEGQAPVSTATKQAAAKALREIVADVADEGSEAGAAVTQQLLAAAEKLVAQVETQEEISGSQVETEQPKAVEPLTPPLQRATELYRQAKWKCLDESYQEALELFDQIDEVSITGDFMFTHYYSKAAIKTKKYEQAMDKIREVDPSSVMRSTTVIEAMVDNDPDLVLSILPGRIAELITRINTDLEKPLSPLSSAEIDEFIASHRALIQVHMSRGEEDEARQYASQLFKSVLHQRRLRPDEMLVYNARHNNSALMLSMLAMGYLGIAVRYDAHIGAKDKRIYGEHGDRILAKLRMGHTNVVNSAPFHGEPVWSKLTERRALYWARAMYRRTGLEESEVQQKLIDFCREMGEVNPKEAIVWAERLVSLNAEQTWQVKKNDPKDNPAVHLLLAQAYQNATPPQYEKAADAYLLAKKLGAELTPEQIANCDRALEIAFEKAAANKDFAIASTRQTQRKGLHSSPSPEQEAEFASMKRNLDGLLLIIERKYQQAVEHLDPIIEANPQDCQALLLRGIAKFNLDEDEEAQSDLEGALSLAKAQDRPFMQARCEDELAVLALSEAEHIKVKAELALGDQEWEKAAQLIQQALEMLPETATPEERQTLEQQQREICFKAADAISDAIDEAPIKRRNIFRYHKAIMILDQALPTDRPRIREDLDLLELRADLCQLDGRIQEARRDIEAAVILEPTAEFTRMLQLKVMRKQRKWDELADLASRMIANEVDTGDLPNFTGMHTEDREEVYMLYAIALHQQGNVEEAIATAEEALTVDPTSFEANFFLGTQYLAQEEYAQAREKLQAGVAVLEAEEDQTDPMLQHSLKRCREALAEVEQKNPKPAQSKVSSTAGWVWRGLFG